MGSARWHVTLAIRFSALLPRSTAHRHAEACLGHTPVRCYDFVALKRPRDERSQRSFTTAVGSFHAAMALVSGIVAQDRLFPRKDDNGVTAGPTVRE